MSLRRTNLVLGALVLLLGVPVVLDWSASSSDAFEITEREPLFPGFTRAQVQFIRIEQPAALLRIGEEDAPTRMDERAMLELRRSRDSSWVVGSDPNYEGLPVLENRIDLKIFELFEDAPGGDPSLILEGADDDELAANLVNRELGTTITCLDVEQNELATLILGRRTNRRNSSDDEVRGFFIRDPETRDIRLFERPGLLMTARPADWFDRRLFGADIEQVNGVTWRNRLGRLVVRRDPERPGIWKAVEKGFTDPDFTPGPLNHTEVTRLLVALLRTQIADIGPRVPLRAEDRPRHLDPMGLATPTTGIQLELQDGRAVEVTLGNDVTGDNTTFAWIAGWPFTIEVSTDAVASELRRDPRELFR